jgi:hypothetical protein
VIVRDRGVVRPVGSGDKRDRRVRIRHRPTSVQRRWLVRGLNQPGGKLPLFDESGQAMNAQTIRSCVRQGWAEPWIRNPIKPDWLVCRLTDAGRKLITTGDDT